METDSLRRDSFTGSTSILRLLLSKARRQKMQVAWTESLVPGMATAHSDCVGCGRMLIEFERRSLRKISAQLRSEPGNVVCEEHELMTGTGDGDVCEAGVEQIGMNRGIGIDQDALCCQALGAMAGNGVAVIKVAMFNSRPRCSLSPSRLTAASQPVSTTTAKSTSIPCRLLDGEQIGSGVDTDHRSIQTRFDPEALTSARISDGIVDLVATGP